MQFVLHFHSTHPLVLPISYHSEVQGMIYRILSQSPAYSAFLHDEGYFLNGRKYKLFVYSLLTGKYDIHMPEIIFQGDFSLEVRSPKQNFCELFTSALMKDISLELNHQPISLSSFEVHSDRIDTDHVQIDMLSPMCLHRTEKIDEEQSKTIYLAPTDPDFNRYLNMNLHHKLAASEDREPYEEIHLAPLYPDHGGMQKRDKYVTRFDNRILINAWRGKYRLSGDPRDLSFLYDAGLGTRNSQGFGMFRII